jgi:hypothetical protein
MKNLIFNLVFVFLFGSSTQMFSQNFYTLNIVNNTSCTETVQIFGSGVLLGNYTMTANSTLTVTCQNGKPDNIRFANNTTPPGLCSFQIPINQSGIECDDPTCTTPYCCAGGCCFDADLISSTMNTTAAAVPGTCNGGIGFYWNLTITIG